MFPVATTSGQKVNRTQSTGDHIIKTPRLQTANTQQASVRASQQSLPSASGHLRSTDQQQQHFDRDSNPLYKSNRMDKRINVRANKEAESRQSRPSLMSSRRPILIDDGAANFLAERDENEEDDDNVLAEVIQDSQDNFDQMALDHRGGPPSQKISNVPEVSRQLELSHDFDVIESPATTQKAIEEQKGANSKFSVSNAKYNIVKNQNHFEMDDDAYEDSDEEFAPLESIVPNHLQKKENLQGYVKKMPAAATALENQMNLLDSRDSSAAFSFQIGGHTSKPKSSTMKDSRTTEQKPSAGQADQFVDFQAQLLSNNLQNIEQPLSTTESDSNSKAAGAAIDNIQATQSELQQINKRSTQLQVATQKTFRKRVTIVTSENSESVDDHKSTSTGMLSNRNREGAVYRKKGTGISVAETSVGGGTSERAQSEKSYDSESDIDLDYIEELEREEQRKAELAIKEEEERDPFKTTPKADGNAFLQDLLERNFDEVDESIDQKAGEEKKQDKKHLKKQHETTEDIDMIHLVEESEHLFIRYAQQKLVDNKLLLDERASKALEGLKRKELIQQRVLSEVCPRNYGAHEAQFVAARANERHTCIVVSDEVVCIGTQLGTFNAYNRETCQPYGRFEDTHSDFENNPVTCMHIHPLRTEYLVVGFQGGQFMIVDLSMLDKNSMLKPKKLVKDHHKNQPLVSVKFCDWYREREVVEENKGAPVQEDTQAWMIASVDIEGRVVISCVRDIAMGILKASKFVILDPRKQAPEASTELSRFQVIEPRFFKMIFPQGQYNDSQTWLALANRSEVQILQVTKETCRSCFSVRKPTFYASERTNKYEMFPDTLPVMAWGYGKSPCFKHRTQAMLAISWGSLIQLVLLIPDDEKIEQGMDFRVDGQYFIAPGTVQDMVPGTSIMQDLRIESMKFLSESVLFVYTSTQDIRVLYTQSFKNGPYEFPTQEQLNDSAPRVNIFNNMDSRLKLMEVNSALTKEQRAIEMERRKFLSSPLVVSQIGGKASQTLTAFEDWVVFITEAGFCSVQHMTWQEYVETSEQEMDSTWIDTFQKALDIFDGKIKGFKGVVDDRDLRQESMKAELKLLVTDLIDKLIAQWKKMADKMEKNGQPHVEVVEHFQNKQRVLIKRSIEICVDIWEPFFLFNELFQKFVDQEMQGMFAEELKPYILSGTFMDTDMPETILVHHILKHPYERFEQQENEKNHHSPSSGELSSAESPAESFEKIIVNLSFNCCSPEYQATLLNFCKEKKLSTGHFYLAINYAGDDGIRVALHQLRTFYLQFIEEEKMNVSHRNTMIIDRETLSELRAYEADMQYREVYEKSAIYIGYKLLWVIRLTLLGKRFPKGHYEMKMWQEIVHEVLDIITQEDFMKTLFEIDASAYFQIITIAFNNPSVQYDFLLKGRGPHVNLMQDAKMSMTHAELVKRISDYCLLQLEEGSEVRLQYLFFIASIAEENQELRDQAFYYKVTLELIKHHTQFLVFNRSLIQRQMTQKQMYRKLSRKGFQAPDKVKHVVLSEESIMVLVRKCEPLGKEQINQLVESIADTNFDSLKLMLFEKQEAYTQCLSLLASRESVSTFVTLKMRDRFAWIIQTYFMLESRLGNRNENTHNRYQLDNFEKGIFQFAHTLTRIDAHKAVGLIDCLFKDQVSMHLAFMVKMNDYKEEQFMYTNKLLEINFDRAKTSMTEYSMVQQQMTPSAGEAEDWLKILNKNLELACQLEPDSVVQKVKANLKKNFYPPEECLKICQEYERTEACAILCKFIGMYKKSVKYYVDLINQSIIKDKNILMFKKELHELDKHIRVTLLKQKRMLADKEFEYHRRMQHNMQSASEQNDDVGNFQQLSVDIESLLVNSRSDLVPVAYSSQFSMKEKFIDAIQLKVFIAQNCPHVSLLERVLKILIKMINSHPDEVLKNKNEKIWLLIIKMMFSLTQHKELHRKRYCRRYLIVKMVTLVKEMLKHIPMQDIVNGILGISKNIKFRAVKKLISDVFWDKHAEADLCANAANISHSELKELQSEWFNLKGDGLVFKYTKCDLCQQHVGQTSLRLMNTFSGHLNRKDDHDLVMFDCSKESSYNHAFHERCLKKQIKEEMRKDKKANLQSQNVGKHIRCVICYKQSQNIDGLGLSTQKSGSGGASGSSRQASRRRNRDRSATPNRLGNELTSGQIAAGLKDSDNSSTSGSQSSAAMAATRRIGSVRVKTFQEEQNERVMKKLALFDKDLKNGVLQANNFL